MKDSYFAHLGICVKDLDASMRFYREALGFSLVAGTTVGPEVGPLIGLDADEITLHSRFMQKDGTRIELLHYETPVVSGAAEMRPMDKRGLTHLALRVEDVSVMAGRVEEFGGTILHDSRVGEAAAGVVLIYVLDPDGVRIELIQIPGALNSPLGEPMVDV